ncbi:membrane protein insertase, YidC/Oxa1 family [Thermanaerovibrio velox DSM 12556]|uniref:Membrane protein insertase, YidC/Oxa1 family n=1 Tax=Thermanaerovibrio velox DSM 12556 TaxID=926567 RepID=H0USC8_9BACT|nr:YidC/Oxa1 family membrane protein insertase [Thermanaerovibrio velox]EHM10217.1 membrane protein insertase, YidC/Oxa1 family [Thermanaerovibrio velox DSM 12556]
MGSLWNAAGDLMLGTLNFFYSITRSYGLSIILLTVVVRILLHPLSHKQMVSMQRMQKIQPRLKVIQEKYANDKEKMNQEMMQLYKEHGVNPAAGCLPLLVQLPIFILLYRVLMNYDFSNTSFLGVPLSTSALGALGAALGMGASKPTFTAVLGAIITNPAGLARVDLYGASVILIAVVGFLTWYQQKLSSGNNPQMAFMNWFMPLFMSFICLSLPGGVMIYWGASSLISVAQQKWVLMRTEEEMKVKPVLHKNKPEHKDVHEVEKQG